MRVETGQSAIDQKLRVGDVVFLREAMEERRRGVNPAAAVHVDFYTSSQK